MMDKQIIDKSIYLALSLLDAKQCITLYDMLKDYEAFRHLHS